MTAWASARAGRVGGRHATPRHVPFAEATSVLTRLGFQGCPRTDRAGHPHGGHGFRRQLGRVGTAPPEPALAQGQEYGLPGPKPLGSTRGHSPERPRCTARPLMGLEGAGPALPPAPQALTLPHQRRGLSSEAGAAAGTPRAGRTFRAFQRAKC